MKTLKEYINPTGIVETRTFGWFCPDCGKWAYVRGIAPGKNKKTCSKCKCKVILRARQVEHIAYIAEIQSGKKIE